MLDSESHGSKKGPGLQRCVLGQRNVPNQQAQAEEEQAEGDSGETPLAPLAAELGHSERAFGPAGAIIRIYQAIRHSRFGVRRDQ